MKPWREGVPLDAPLLQARLRPSDAENRNAPADGVSPRELEALLQASFERGRTEGERALSSQLLQQRAQLQELIRGALKALHDAVPQVARDIEHALIELALEVARKLVAETPINAAMIEASVREALSQVEHSTEFHVRLHAADFELLKQAASPLLSESQGDLRAHFSTSPDVTRGGCMVQTRFGIIDARRETRFDLLKRAVLP